MTASGLNEPRSLRFLMTPHLCWWRVLGTRPTRKSRLLSRLATGMGAPLLLGSCAGRRRGFQGSPGRAFDINDAVRRP